MPLPRDPGLQLETLAQVILKKKINETQTLDAWFCDSNLSRADLASLDPHQSSGQKPAPDASSPPRDLTCPVAASSASAPAQVHYCRLQTEMSTEGYLDGEEARGLEEVSLSWGARVCRLVAAVTTQ